MKKFVFVFVFMFSLFAESATADLLGLANGRSANLDNMADMSVEGGLNLHGDEKLFGARVNFKASSDMMVFGDIGMFDVDDFRGGDGIAFGFGVFYQLRDVKLLENTDFAVKGAYHLVELDFGSFTVPVFNEFGAFVGNESVSGTADWSEISLDALISGDQLGESDLGWYANAGLHIFDYDGATGDGTKILLGGGVTKPLSFGEAFAGLDILAGARLVAGVRYNL